MCPGVDSASENEYQGFLLGYRRPVRRADDLPSSQCRTSRKSGALTYPEPLGPPRHVMGDLYLYKVLRKIKEVLFHVKLFLQTEFLNLIVVIVLPTQPSFYNYIDPIDRQTDKVTYQITTLR